MNVRRFFRFHLATLLAAMLLASGVLYLNFANRMKPYLMMIFALKAKLFHVEPEKARLPVARRFFTRCYFDSPGWPLGIHGDTCEKWPDQIDSPPIDDMRFIIAEDEWKKYGFGMQGTLFGDPVPEEVIFSKAPQFAARVYTPPTKAVFTSDSIDPKNLAANIGVGLLIVLVPCIALEWYLRRRDSMRK